MTFQALRRREPGALEDLLVAYGRELQAVAYVITRDRADAEDVVAETLLTAFDKATTIRDESALRSWLIRVATNRALTLRRSQARVVPLHVAPERADHRDPSAAASDRVVLLDGVATLPPRTRAAIALRYFADLSVEETADVLGRSPNTIKTQLREALVMLRAHLAEPAAPDSAEEASHA
jgi:RNA polymerase sigma-70 factor (ECF subfamily)